MPPPHHLDVRSWFSDEELERCPSCRQRTAFTMPGAGAVICTECGVVGFRAESNTPDVELHGFPPLPAMSPRNPRDAD